MADQLQEIGETIETGGERFNLLLVAVFVVIALIVGITLVHSLWGAGAVTSQTATSQLDDDDAARDQARVNELASYAAAPEEHKQVLQLSPVQTRATQPAPSATPLHQPSPYQLWAREESLRAHSAMPMVGTFHDRAAFQVAQADRQRVGGDQGGQLHPPASPYTVMAGSIIPAVLVNGINSDLPGPVIAQVSENVFDTATGKLLLVPQGSKLLGQYSDVVGYGQQRVRLEFERLIFPDTSSIDLPHSTGTDADGYAGISDQVNNHYLATFGTAAAMALISAGQAVGQIAAFNNSSAAAYGPYGYQPQSQWDMATQTAGTGASSQMGAVGAQVIGRGLNRAPTLTVRPGFQFEVLLTSDVVLPQPYGAQG